MYTRGGDKGETGLYGSKRVPKDSLRVEAYGTIDELNSSVGVAIAKSDRADISDQLRAVQRLLFVAGADLAAVQQSSPEPQSSRIPRITKNDTQMLEDWVDSLQSKLPRLTSFILPGGSELSSHLHMARSICRRAERRVVALAKDEEINTEMTPFLNRLSTYLFNVARYSNSVEGKEDELWKGF